MNLKEYKEKEAIVYSSIDRRLSHDEAFQKIYFGERANAYCKMFDRVIYKCFGYKQNLPKNGYSSLEIGFNDGLGFDILGHQYKIPQKMMMGIEIDQDHIDTVERLFPNVFTIKCGLEKYGGTMTLPVLLENMSKKVQFKFIYSHFSMDYVEDVHDVLRAIHLALKPGGIFAMVCHKKLFGENFFVNNFGMDFEKHGDTVMFREDSWPGIMQNCGFSIVDSGTWQAYSMFNRGYYMIIGRKI